MKEPWDEDHSKLQKRGRILVFALSIVLSNSKRMLIKSGTYEVSSVEDLRRDSDVLLNTRYVEIN